MPRETYTQRRIRQLEDQIRNIEYSPRCDNESNIYRLRMLRDELANLTQPTISVQPMESFDESSPWVLASDYVRRLDEEDDRTMSSLRRMAQQRLEEEERLFRNGDSRETEPMDAVLRRLMNDNLYRSSVGPYFLSGRPGRVRVINPDMPIEGSPVVYNLVRVQYKHNTPVQPGKDFSYKITVTTK